MNSVLARQTQRTASVPERVIFAALVTKLVGLLKWAKVYCVASHLVFITTVTLYTTLLGQNEATWHSISLLTSLSVCSVKLLSECDTLSTFLSMDHRSLLSALLTYDPTMTMSASTEALPRIASVKESRMSPEVSSHMQSVSARGKQPWDSLQRHMPLAGKSPSNIWKDFLSYYSTLNHHFCNID